MKEFFESFSNREIAIIFWLFLGLLIMIFNSRESRKSFSKFVIQLFDKKLIPFYIIIALYLSAMIKILILIKIWEIPLYKDFIFWFFTAGIILFYKSNEIDTYKDFAKIIFQLFTLFAILEFIIGVYNFSLIGEIILVFFVTLISIMVVVAERKKETHQVASFLNIILSISGLGMIIFVLYKLITSYDLLFTLSNLKSFLLTPFFTLIFLPIIYLTVLYIKYEVIFHQLNRYQFISRKRKRNIKFGIFRFSNFSLPKIKKARNIVFKNKREIQNEENILRFLKTEITS